MKELPLGTSAGLLNPNTMSEDDWFTLRMECEQLFTPGTPIKQNELFAGRSVQIQKLSQRIRSPGTHAIVYGERGVGKSSLVNVFKFIADQNAARIQYVRVAGVAGDDFNSLFNKVFKRITIEGPDGHRLRLADQYEGKTITSDDVLLEFEDFPTSMIPVIVIDEFDKIVNRAVKEEVAETIKLVSDEGANVTFFVVGIADSVADLIEGHESIDRAVAQVEMPRMTDQEIIEIIHPRLKSIGFKISEDALWDCVFLAKGLPFYAHLLGQHAAQAACDAKTVLVNKEIVAEARDRAIGESNSTIRTNFDDAVHSERRDNIFLPVLLACALCRKDPSGRFLAKDVAKVLSDIMGQDYGVPAFSYHLDQFATHDRGRMLEKLGAKRQFRFRFKEALTEPYVLLKGKQFGLISEDIENKYGPTREPDLFSIL